MLGAAIKSVCRKRRQCGALLPGNGQILFATQRQEFIGARHTIGSDCWLVGFGWFGGRVSAFANGTSVMMC